MMPSITPVTQWPSLGDAYVLAGFDLGDNYLGLIVETSTEGNEAQGFTVGIRGILIKCTNQGLVQVGTVDDTVWISSGSIHTVGRANNPKIGRGRAIFMDGSGVNPATWCIELHRTGDVMEMRRATTMHVSRPHASFGSDGFMDDNARSVFFGGQGSSEMSDGVPRLVFTEDLTPVFGIHPTFPSVTWQNAISSPVVVTRDNSTAYFTAAGGRFIVENDTIDRAGIRSLVRIDIASGDSTIVSSVEYPNQNVGLPWASPVLANGGMLFTGDDSRPPGLRDLQGGVEVDLSLPDMSPLPPPLYPDYVAHCGVSSPTATAYGYPFYLVRGQQDA